MSTQTTNSTSSEQFQKYLNLHKDKVRTSVAKEYYHVNVVADAFKEGFSAGEKSIENDELYALIKQKIEEILQKALQVHLLTNRLASFIRSNGNNVHSFYINVFHNNPKAVVAVSDELLLDDDFVTKTYLKLFEMKKIFNELYDVELDMGIMGSNELDSEALIDDGYEYFEEIK